MRKRASLLLLLIPLGADDHGPQVPGPGIERPRSRELAADVLEETGTTHESATATNVDDSVLAGAGGVVTGLNGRANAEIAGRRITTAGARRVRPDELDPGSSPGSPDVKDVLIAAADFRADQRVPEMHGRLSDRARAAGQRGARTAGNDRRGDAGRGQQKPGRLEWSPHLLPSCLAVRRVPASAAVRSKDTCAVLTLHGRQKPSAGRCQHDKSAATDRLERDALQQGPGHQMRQRTSTELTPERASGFACAPGGRRTSVQ